MRREPAEALTRKRAPARKRLANNRQMMGNISHADRWPLSARRQAVSVGQWRGHDIANSRMGLSAPWRDSAAAQGPCDGCAICGEKASDQGGQTVARRQRMAAERNAVANVVSVTVLLHLFVSNINGLTHKI